jgi:uncharacterized surface protein with fasciclin (FAS1) repeats
MVAMCLFFALSVTAQAQTIVELASGQENLSTLVAALEAADLTETLQGEGPFTVFAPSNEAFASLPEGTWNALLQPENKEKLVKILTYHVVEGKMLSTEMSDGQKASTSQGSEVEISLTDNGAKINEATVLSSDILATNGVVHIIDKVIMPPPALKN